MYEHKNERMKESKKEGKFADFTKNLYCSIVLFFDGEVIAAQCTTTFSRSIVLPRI